MLSSNAFNAFLKTLEEPPSYAIFILATTEKHKIIPTILSRCQIFDFTRIRIEDIANHLAEIAKKEEIKYDSDGLHLIAQKADGGLRDALSMFDQIVSFSNKNVNYKSVIDNLNILDYDYYFKITDALLTQNVADVLLTFDDILTNGFDGNHFITGLASHFRNLLVGKDPITLKLLEVSEGIFQKYLQQSAKTSASFLISALNIANQCDLNYKTSKNQRLQVELTLIKLCHIQSVLNLSSAPIITENIPQGGQEKKNSDPIVVPKAYPLEKAASIPDSSEEIIEKSEDQQATELIPEAVSFLAEPNILIKKQDQEIEKIKVSIPKPSLMAGASFIPNLNDLNPSNKLEEEVPDYISGESENPFTEDELLKLWNQYAGQIKQAGKINLFTLMTANPPSLKENHQIELILDNKTQENSLSNEKIDLLNFLRVELKNYKIDIITRYLEQTDKKRLYTSTERYQHMVEINPKLEDFKRRFNLDVDY